MTRRDRAHAAGLNALALDDLYAALATGDHARRLFELARDEDAAADDITTRLFCHDRGRRVRAAVRSRRDAVVAGLACVRDLAAAFGGSVEIEPRSRDGEAVASGGVIAVVDGPKGAVLALERTLLNTLGRLCGVATQTRAYVEAAAAGGAARVCDTRKTTPGLRALEKYAVRCGGGWLHRLNLADAVLIKDNHIAGVDGAELPALVRRASRAARDELGPGGFVEMEFDTLGQLRRVLEGTGDALDIALVDNMTPDEIAEAVRLRDEIAPRVEIEASGSVTLSTIAGIAATGVDRIAVGALTHGATGIDVGLDAD